MRQRALIDLAMVLDIRYGVLSRMNQEYADELADSEVYSNRYHDDFGSLSNGIVNQEEYVRILNEHDPDTLFFCRMSDFMLEMRMDLKAGLTKVDRGVFDIDFMFDINTWPYKLGAEEQEVIRRAVQRLLSHPAKVTMVDLPPEFLTPQYVESTYEMMAWYNHEDWLGAHQNALIKHRLPTTVLLTPQIATSNVLPEQVEGIGNPFMCRSAMLVKFIALHYINTRLVCYNPNIKRLVESHRRSEAAPPDPVPPEHT